MCVFYCLRFAIPAEAQTLKKQAKPQDYADHIANLALQSNEPAMFLDEVAFQAAVSSSFTLFFFADGGFWHSEDRAAGTWILYSLGLGTFEMLAFQAAMLESHKTSIHAELKASNLVFKFLQAWFGL